MARPNDSELVKAKGTIAPQAYDVNLERWEYLNGERNHLYVTDDTIFQESLTDIENVDGSPRDGRKALATRTGSVYVGINRKWVEI